MSLIEQKATFAGMHRNLTLISDPETIDAVEHIAVHLFGASKDFTESTDGYDYFSFQDGSLCEKKIQAIEKIWNLIPTISSYKKIRLSCKNQGITITGDNGAFKAFVALVQLFNRDTDGNVYFSDDEEATFYAIHDAAQGLGLIPVL